MEIGGPRHVHMTIENLQQENERLHNELDQARKTAGSCPEIDDPDFLERFLTDTYRPIDEILTDIIESDVLNELIQKRDQLDSLYRERQDLQRCRDELVDELASLRDSSKLVGTRWVVMITTSFSNTNSEPFLDPVEAVSIQNGLVGMTWHCWRCHRRVNHRLSNGLSKCMATNRY